MSLIESKVSRWVLRVEFVRFAIDLATYRRTFMPLPSMMGNSVDEQIPAASVHGREHGHTRNHICGTHCGQRARFVVHAGYESVINSRLRSTNGALRALGFRWRTQAWINIGLDWNICVSNWYFITQIQLKHVQLLLLLLACANGFACVLNFVHKFNACAKLPVLITQRMCFSIFASDMAVKLFRWWLPRAVVWVIAEWWTLVLQTSSPVYHHHQRRCIMNVVHACWTKKSMIFFLVHGRDIFITSAQSIICVLIETANDECWTNHLSNGYIMNYYNNISHSQTTPYIHELSAKRPTSSQLLLTKFVYAKHTSATAMGMPTAD